MSQLNDEARDHIRRYMLTLVALPGIAISVFSAIAGYLIHAHGEREAYIESFVKLSGPAIDSAKAAAVAQEIAESTRKKIDVDAAKIADLRKQVETSAALVSTSNAIDEIVGKLIADPGLSDRLIKASSARLSTLEVSVNALGKGRVTKELSVTNPGTAGPDVAECPYGSYVSSIEARLGVSGKYATDGIKQLVIKCRAIR